MIEGGENLRDGGLDADPEDSFGHRFDPFEGSFYIGTMPDHLEALHIYNPQIGYRYMYALNPTIDGGSSVLKMQMRYSAEMVTNDDPEKIGLGRLAAQSGTHVGSTRAFGDVVLMRVPQSRYDEVTLLEQEREKHSLEGIVHKYLGEDPHYMGKPLRHVGSDHGTTVEDL